MQAQQTETNRQAEQRQIGINRHKPHHGVKGEASPESSLFLAAE